MNVKMDKKHFLNFNRMMRGMTDIKSIMSFLIDVEDQTLLLSGINILILKGDYESLSTAYKELLLSFPIFSGKINRLNKIHEMLSEDIKPTMASPAKRKSTFTPKSKFFPSPQEKRVCGTPPSSSTESSPSTSASGKASLNLEISDIMISKAGFSQEILDSAHEEMRLASSSQDTVDPDKDCDQEVIDVMEQECMQLEVTPPQSQEAKKSDN